ncbi:MAG: ATP-binding protein [Candidatus Thorarchaeota archaeon]
MAKMDRRHVINAMMSRECFTRVDDKLTNDLRPLKKILETEKDALVQLRQRKDDVLRNKKEFETKQAQLKQYEEQLKQVSQSFAQTEKTYNAVKAYRLAKEVQADHQRELDYHLETQKRLEKQLKSRTNLQKQQKKLQIQQKQLTNLQTDVDDFEKAQAISTKLKRVTDQQQMTSEAITRLNQQIGDFAISKDVVIKYEQIQTKRLHIEASQRRIFSPLLYLPSIGLLAAGIMALFFNLIVGGILLIASIPFLGYLGITYRAYSRAGTQLTELRHQEDKLGEQVAAYRTKDALEDQLNKQQNEYLNLESQTHQLAQDLLQQLSNFSKDILSDITLSDDIDPAGLQRVVAQIEQKIMQLQVNQRSLIDQLQTVNDQMVSLTEAEKDLTQIETEISSLREQLETLTLPELPTEIGEYSEDLFHNLEEQIQTLGEKKAELQAFRKNTADRIEELLLLIKEYAGVQEAFTAKEKEVARLDENIKSGRLTIDLIREVAERGREQVRPRVVQVMERLLATITDGKYRFPKLSEDYSLKVYSATAGEYVEANLYSGGTEDQFLLALRLGFAIALLPEGRGATPQFLLLDEPFGGSDIQRRDNIIRLLQDELSRTFPQIIVVSHQNAILSASEHQFRMINGRAFHSE